MDKKQAKDEFLNQLKQRKIHMESRILDLKERHVKEIAKEEDELQIVNLQIEGLEKLP